MAPKSKVDCTQEILEFRRILSATLFQVLYDLDKELCRIQLILNPKEETQISESETQDQVPFTSTLGLRVVGNIDLTHFDPKKGKKRERIKGPRMYLISKEASDCYQERKALVESFIRSAYTDKDYVQDLFLLRSSLQFAVMKKEISDLNCDYRVIRPYTGSLLTPDEIAEFLVYYKWIEPELTRGFLTNLSCQYGDLSILHSVFDNAYRYSNDDDRKQAKSKIVDMILRLGKDQVAFSKDISAIKMALDNYVLYDLGCYISVAKEITDDSLSCVVFPLSDDRIESLEFGYMEFSIEWERKDEYSNELDKVLKHVVKEGYISPNEHAAITGKEIVLTTESGVGAMPGSKSSAAFGPDKDGVGNTVNNITISFSSAHVERNTTTINNQQINIVNPGVSDDNTQKGDALATIPISADQPTQTESISAAINPPRPTKKAVPSNDETLDANKKVLVSPEDSLPDSPRRFINNKAAFIKLYEKLVQDEDLPKEMDPNNWCRLFKLEMRDDTPLYKLAWLKTKPALRCFLEELYRPFPMPSQLNHIFIIPKSRGRLKITEIKLPSKRQEQNYRDKFNRFIDAALGTLPS